MHDIRCYRVRRLRVIRLVGVRPHTRLQDRLVLINNRPVIKIDMERGCCKFVNQPLEGGPEDKDEDHGKNE